MRFVPAQLAALALAAACSRDAEVNGARPASGACRAPDEPGCRTCCEPRADPAGAPWCSYRSFAGPEGRTRHGLIYDRERSVPGACPEDCAPCAPCDRSKELSYRMLGKRTDCLCSLQGDSLDPCYAAESCGCYCEQLRDLAACFDLDR